MKRVLIVQTAFVGDVVLTTPLLREVRRCLDPEDRLAVLATPAGAALLEGHDALNEILVYDKKGDARGNLGTFRTAGLLRRGRFDVAVAAQRSFRTGVILFSAGIPLRVGFRGAKGSWAYHRKVRWNGERHAVHRYLALAGGLGGAPEEADPYPDLAVPQRHREKVLTLLAGEGIGERDPYVCLAPGSVWGTKRWTPEGYGEIARRIVRDGYRAVMVGSPDERELCERVRDLAGGTPPVLAGRTSLPELTAVLQSAAALVSNDSGPAHIAAAVETPVVTVFGPTVPAFGYTPYGRRVRIVELADLECRPCHHHGPRTCPLEHFRCMREIGAGEVHRNLLELLEETG